MIKLDYFKIISGILMSIIGLFIIFSGTLGAIITGSFLIILGVIIIFNKDENKIEKIKTNKKK